MTASENEQGTGRHRGAALLALFVTVVLGVGLLFGITAGVGAIWSNVGPSGAAAAVTTSGSGSSDMASTASKTSNASGSGQSGSAEVVPIVLQRDDTSGPAGTITNKDGWPRYSPSDITVPAGKTVTLVIDNYDDMATPLPSALQGYDKVQGGTETVNGKAITTVSNKMIAHTFTVPSLGLNIPIPMATDVGSGSSETVVPAVVTFTFTPKNTGTFTWQCFTPCGSGSDGMSGPMSTAGWMRGSLTVA